MDYNDDHSTIDYTELYSIKCTFGDCCVYLGPGTIGEYGVYTGSSHGETVEDPDAQAGLCRWTRRLARPTQGDHLC